MPAQGTPPVAPDPATALDTLLPEYDVRTIYGRGVDAPVDRVAAAIRSTPLADAHIAALLLAVRTAGRSLRGPDRLIADAGDGAAGFFRVADLPHEVVTGFAGRPWPGGEQGGMPRTSEEWRAFEPTDAVKVALSVRCLEARYGTLLVTETRIRIGNLARRPFNRYWLLIRPGSRLVRTSLLRAIAREATK